MLAVFVARVRAVVWLPDRWRRDEAWTGGRRRNDREIAASFVASLLIHLAIACFFLVAALVEPDKPKIGSEELDIELVAPRLAPPPANNAAIGARQREGPRGVAQLEPRAQRAVSEAARSKEAQWRISPRMEALDRPALAPQSKQSTQQAAEMARQQQRRDAVNQRNEQQAAAQGKEQRLQPSKMDRSVATRQLSRSDETERQDNKRRLSAKSGLSESELSDDPTSVGRLACLPQDIDPTRLLTAVKSEIVAREERRKRHRAQLRERDRRLARRWARFKRSTETPMTRSAAATATVASAALAGFAALGTSGSKAVSVAAGRNGEGTRGAGKSQRSRSPRYGLKFYLSGRPLATSKVVHPPQLISFSRYGCRIASPEVTPATVRALVTLEGKIDVAYIRHSSSNRSFDTCALKQVRGMRFRPGVDKAGKPLDVWIHVRVAPGLPTTAL